MLTINNTLDGYLKDVEIKGNTVQDPDNLADIRSVGDKVEGQELYEIPVSSCGKNLFDGKFIDGKAINFTTGEYYDNTAMCASTNFISANGNSNYYLNVNPYGWVVEYDANKKCITGRQFWNTFRTSENCRYVKFYIGKDVKTDTIQLEEGTQSTPYEPYIEDKLTILSPTPLEKVGDGADRIIEKDGVWGVEKNVVDKVLNGDVQLNSIQLNTNNVTPNSVFTETTNPVLIDNVNSYKYSNWEDGKKDLWGKAEFDGKTVYSVKSNGVVQFMINNTKLSSLTVDGVKRYLNDNNLLIKYPTTNPQFIPLPHDQQVKLRTFANKTNISFLTEVEGTIKAQVPKSLGATVNTHTEQISNLNKELDRVKKLEESTVSTVTTESDFTTVEATTRGYFEDVKLEGKTLVNKNILPNKTSTSGYVILYDNLSLDEGKTYTIINTFDTQIKINDASYTKGNFTFIANTKNAIRVLSSDGTSQLPANYWNILILEGDHTQNPPSYFEGLKSVGQSATTSDDGADEIVVSSVDDGNMIHLDNIVKGYYLNGSGGRTHNPNSFYTNYYIRISHNNRICLKTRDNSKQVVIVALYTKNKELINNNEYTTNAIFNIPINAKYMRLSFYNRLDIKEQLYVGYDDSYNNTPHQSDKKRLLYYNEETQTWEKPILREWDSIEKHSDGKYYYHQRSGELVLNGSEIWEKVSPPYTEDANIYFCCRVLDTVSVKRGKFISDRFNKEDVYNTDKEGLYIYDTSTYKLRINIMKSKLSTQDVEGFKKWLQANNLTVVYQLAEEKVYECTNIDLITYNGETNFIVESGVLSPKTTLKVHSNISNVVSLLQKKVSLLESNMTKYMITQNRLQLSSTHSADSVTFKVDYTVCSENMSQENYDTDLYNLILNNILVGKDNYDYDHMFNIIMDYASWSQISWDQFDILVGLMDIQHNPPIEEIPTDDEIVEEIPNEIM